MTHQGNVSFREFQDAVASLKKGNESLALAYLEKYKTSNKSYHQRNCTILTKLTDPKISDVEKAEVFACAELLSIRV